jgi:anthranilate synthase component 1
MILPPPSTPSRPAWARGENQVVHARLAADLDTPVSLMLKLGEARADTFMLESVTGGEVRGRYSIVGMKPDLIWRCHGTKSSEINREARFDATAFRPLDGHPLDTLRALIAESRIEMPEGLPAISAGLFGYLGYDMIRLVERLPNVNPDPIGLPDAVLMRPSVVAVLDGVKGEVTVVAPAWAASGLSARAAYAQAAERVMDALRDLDRAPAAASRDLGQAAPVGQPRSNFTHEGYKQAVEKAKEYIRAGDIFQVVPSQRWAMVPAAALRAVPLAAPHQPLALHVLLQLRRLPGDRRQPRNPGAPARRRGHDPPHRRHPQARRHARRGQGAGGRPAGRPQGTGRTPDAAGPRPQRRGPGGKVGTVRPTEQFIIERYSHVMHIVSNVVGEIRDGEDALSALLAGLPAGTVSGAPKVRAMEIIDELEPEKRGVYGGGVGYFAANGEMDFCIALRTAVLKDETLYIQAGGGVVYDSDPEAEYQETVNKSNALRRAAEDAGMFVRRGNG